ncbi:dedicator of cytokinesis protein 3 isoform X3 [Cydia pomonella]|uniref:dedicator of cytokinesis protein 3 isoform X3 n=1 Tax=Cydia pomonella TaxID=82600 RepID=UPI002ADE273E|nr:dedicator of cytokinesis protein 3 isoform X3 [Cydia pomonella]
MWVPTKSPKLAVAVYNWKGDVRSGLPLEIGETVQILEEHSGWCRGFSTKDRSAWGIFPLCVVSVRPCTVKGSGPTAIAELKDDPLVREIAVVLREWARLWKKLYVERETYRFSAVAKVMRELLSGRRALLAGTLTQDQTRALRLKLVAKLDWGNRKLGLELVPRRGAAAVEPEDMSLVELYRVHVESAERAAAWRGTLRRAGGSGSSFNSGTLTNTSLTNGTTTVQSHHLMCSMRDFGHTAGGDEAELLLWLHDARRAQPLSERFRVRIARDGFSNYVDRLHANSTLFADLSTTDLSRELWLVAWVIRVGRWAGAGGGGGGTGERRGPVARRPLGAGVLPLAEFLRQPVQGSTEKEYTFKVYQSEEKDFHQLHDMLIRKQTNKCNVLPGQPNYGIVVALRLLTNAGSINEAVASGATVTAKRGFPDVIMPGDVRNDLYLTLEKAEFERGGKSTAKNVLATVTVHDNTGQTISDCVWGASGSGATLYESLVLYHNNSPAWGEQLRLTVPLETFTLAHVRIEFRHCSTRDKNERKLFGFSFARLMEASGATLRDGAHELYVYKCDDPAKLATASYLSLPSCSADAARTPTNGVVVSFQRSSKENCTISTLLCSTKLTQNEDLLALLQWRARPEKVQETLLRVLRLGDGLSCEELIKFLRDVLDALFALFSTEDGNSTPHSGTVFLVLVSICSLLDESRFQHFKPVLDVYIEEHFSAALVYKGLLSSVQHCAEWAAGAEGQEPIRKCLRSLGAVFRLAVRSRRLFARATGGQYEDSFRRDVRAALHALKALAQHPHRDHLAPAQVALMTSWASVAKEVASALGPVEAARVTAAMLDAPAANSPPALAKARLAAAQEILKGPLGQDPEARNIVLTTACHHLRVHLARRDELSQCAEMLGELVSLLWKKEDPEEAVDPDELDPDVDVLCLNTLDVLVETVLHLIGGNSPVLGSMVAGLLGCMELLKPAHYQRLWSHLAPHPQDRKPLKDFLMRAFLVFRHLIEQDVFPADWMVLRVQSCKVLLSALQDLAKPLLERFLGDEPPQFDSQLWSGYMELGVALVTSSALTPERWAGRGPDRPRMRAAAGLQVLAVWGRLGAAQLHLVPGAVGALLEITLVGELRRAALGALVSLMAMEREATGSARRTEAALVDKLDSLVADNKADDHYRRLFDCVEHLSSVLMERVSTEGWREAGAAFVGCVTRLLERLLDYRAVMQGAEHRDKRMAATVNLLSFYKNEIDRKEMYLRYVYKLHDLHIASDNFVEAGCTLLLYAETLSWESDQVGVDPEYPETPEWKRKEALYNQVLQYFDRGKCWEKGLPLLRELATLYEQKLCDYARLAHCLRTHATFLDSILTQLRPEPEYFRVGFYGKGCPLFVRNKQFVYRGYDYERIGAFTQRLQSEYVAAHIMMRNTPPDDSIIANDSQYIQICNVKPVAARRQWGSGAPEQARRFYACNDVNTFLCDRPLHKPPIDKDNEFKSLWIERTTLVTENTLPGILRWSEVVSRSVEEIPPVEFACETMESTERELRGLISQYTADPTRNINPFSMRLQGTIDANVQGGISKYEQAFLTAEFARGAAPREAAAAARLRRLVADQLAVVDAGLALHGRLAPEDVKPLHRRLVERFNQLRQNLGPGLARARRQMSESIVNTPLPPVPQMDKRSQSIQQNDNFYEDGHLYNKPIYSLEDCVEHRPESIMSTSLPLSGEKSDGDDSMIKSAPPLPSRPKSGDPRSPTRPPLDNESLDGEAVEPRRHSRASWSEPGDAPPLPPRVSGSARSWTEVPPAVPRRARDEPRAELRADDARDSGVSVGAADHSYTNADDHRRHHVSDFDLTVESLRYEEIISMMSEPLRVDEGETPPPIPPKGLGHLSSFDSGHHENGETNC